MSVSLHTATVSSYLQILASVVGLVDKAEAHCRDNGLPDEALTEARLAEDMWPFAKQVSQSVHHSARALLGVRAGVFRPEFGPVPTDFASIRGELVSAIEMLKAVTPEEIDHLADGELRFEIGSRVMRFIASDFLLSFSLPNFYFHAATAYAILRAQGLPIGKTDFLGRPRILP